MMGSASGWPRAGCTKAKFIWPGADSANCRLARAQLDALVLGLPWQRIGEAGIITIT